MWKPVSDQKNRTLILDHVAATPAAGFIIDTIHSCRRREVPMAEEAFQQEARPRRWLRQGPRSEATGTVEEVALAMAVALAADSGIGGAVRSTTQREG
jgi:hypothetical protein